MAITIGIKNICSEDLLAPNIDGLLGHFYISDEKRGIFRLKCVCKCSKYSDNRWNKDQLHEFLLPIGSPTSKEIFYVNFTYLWKTDEKIG